MSTIRVTPHALDHPIDLDTEAYEQLVRQTEGGWSQCSSTEEWLAKLHYLREGFRQGKIDEAGFREREQQLVIAWWNKGS